MNIEFKVPAIVTDHDGNKQDIELTFKVDVAPASVVSGVVSGEFLFAYECPKVSYSFKEEHPFQAIKRDYNTEEMIASIKSRKDVKDDLL